MTPPYDISSENENTPVSLAGLEARDNIKDKFAYIERHVERMEAQLSCARKVANVICILTSNGLSRPPNPAVSDMSLIARINRYEREYGAEQLPIWEERLRCANLGQDELLDLEEEMKTEYANVENGGTTSERLENVILPNMVRAILRLSRDCWMDHPPGQARERREH